MLDVLIGVGILIGGIVIGWMVRGKERPQTNIIGYDNGEDVSVSDEKFIPFVPDRNAVASYRAKIKRGENP